MRCSRRHGPGWWCYWHDRGDSYCGMTSRTRRREQADQPLATSPLTRHLSALISPRTLCIRPGYPATATMWCVLINRTPGTASGPYQASRQDPRCMHANGGSPRCLPRPTPPPPFHAQHLRLSVVSASAQPTAPVATISVNYRCLWTGLWIGQSVACSRAAPSVICNQWTPSSAA